MKRFEKVEKVLEKLEQVIFDLYLPDADRNELAYLPTTIAVERLQEQVSGPILSLSRGVLKGRNVLLIAPAGREHSAFAEAMDLLARELGKAESQVQFQIRVATVRGPSLDAQRKAMESVHSPLEALSNKASYWLGRGSAPSWNENGGGSSSKIARFPKIGR